MVALSEQPELTNSRGSMASTCSSLSPKGSLMCIYILSVLIYLANELQLNKHGREPDLENDLEDLYGVGVLFSSVTFLIIFRANYGYQHYWEACVSRTILAKFFFDELLLEPLNHSNH